MDDSFLLQMDDSFTEGVCFDTSKDGEGKRRPHAPPFSAKGNAKGRSPVPWEVWEPRPYEISRFAEHIGKVEELCYRGDVPAPPEVVMLSPQTLMSNASMAQI
jgi:hypothetical protein